MKTGPIEKYLLRPFIRHVLRHPRDFDWSVQGFGMLRCYFEADKRFRLNIWDSSIAVPGVSILHDHPWDFTSYIISGHFMNSRFQECTDPIGKEWMIQKIKTGEGGGPVGAPSTIRLQEMPMEHYYTGDIYKQSAEEIHASFYEDGTVTLNDRIRREDGEHALVLWPVGEEWVDAEPRSATEEEIVRITQNALRSWTA